MQGTGFGCVHWVAYWVGLHEASHMADVEWRRVVWYRENVTWRDCVEVVRVFTAERRAGVDLDGIDWGGVWGWVGRDPDAWRLNEKLGM
jgi:hypothetical protein